MGHISVALAPRRSAAVTFTKPTSTTACAQDQEHAQVPIARLGDKYWNPRGGGGGATCAPSEEQ
jgi:hypothetical protein